MARSGVKQAIRNEPLTQEQVSAASGAASGQLGSSARLRTFDDPEEPQDQGIPGGGVPASLLSAIFDYLNREIRAVLIELRLRFNARFGTIEDITADHTVALTEEVLLVTTGASGVTITLPAADDYDKDLVIKKVDAGAGTVTATAAGSDTFTEATTLSSQWDTMVLFSHEGAWYTRSNLA